MLLKKTEGKVIICPACDGTTWIDGKYFVIFGGTGEDEPCQKCDEDGKVYYSEYTSVFRCYKYTDYYKALSNAEIRNYNNKFSTDTFSNEYIDVEVYNMISQEFINELIEKFPEYELGIKECLDMHVPMFLKSIQCYENTAIYDEDEQTLFYKKYDYTYAEYAWFCDRFDILNSKYINMPYIKITFPGNHRLGKKQLNTIIKYLSEITEERKKAIYKYLSLFTYDMYDDDDYLDMEYNNRNDEEPYDYRFIKKNVKNCCFNLNIGFCCRKFLHTQKENW